MSINEIPNTIDLNEPEVNYLSIAIKEGERLRQRFDIKKKQYYQKHFGQWIVLVGDDEDCFFGNDREKAIDYGIQRSNELRTPCPLVFQIGYEDSKSISL